MNNSILLIVFVFIFGLAVVQTIADAKTKECVVNVASVHPDWKPEDLQNSCK